MKRRQFLALLAAGASLAVHSKGFGNVLDESNPFSGERDCEPTKQTHQLDPSADIALSMPTQILDLHSHMFNCRYLPLESIIYDALKHRVFSKIFAQILYRMTESSYRTPSSRKVMRQELPQKPTEPGQDTHFEDVDAFYVEEMWDMAKHELFLTTHDQKLLKQGEDLTPLMTRPKETSTSLMNSDLVKLISQLETIKFKKEWEKAIPISQLAHPSKSLEDSKTVRDVLDVAEYTFKKALWVFVKLVMPKFWSETVHSYAEAFFTLLASEEQLLNRFLKAYGSGLPPIQTVHYMMDMQMAYSDKKRPFYDFPTLQLDRMQTLWRNHAETLFGFSAFDPRRSKWQDLAKESLLKGFIGFKFYPAMGYRPYGDKVKRNQQNINKFFDWCVNEDVPIFAHCTPKGFQTSKNEGGNANPLHWSKALKSRENLRLCLGHAGGGRMGRSAGWLARTENEWATDDNYAYVVVKLCKTYPNVYCEMGYITELLANDADGKVLESVLSNLERARNMDGKYDLMTKIAYGSDWHMPELVTNARRYLNVWLKIFSLPDYKAYQEQFFWKNGKAYLGPRIS